MRHDTEGAYPTGTATAERRIAPLSSLQEKGAVAGANLRGSHVIGSDGRPVGTVHDLLIDTESRQLRYLDVALARDLLSGSPGTREHYGPEGEPMAGAEAMGFAPATGEGPGVVRTSGAARDEVEPVTGHLDESVDRPSHDQVNQTVSAEALEEARSRPLFAPDERPITGHLDEEGLEGGGRHVLIPIGAAHLDETDSRIHVDLGSAEAAALPAYHHESFGRDHEHEVRGRYDRDYVVMVETVEFYSHPLYDEGRFWRGRRQ